MTSEAEILGCEPTEIPEIPGGHCRFAAADQTEYGQSGVPAPQLPNSIRSAVAGKQCRLDWVHRLFGRETSTSAKPSRSSQRSSPSDVFRIITTNDSLNYSAPRCWWLPSANAGSWHNTLFAAVIDDPLCFF